MYTRKHQGIVNLDPKITEYLGGVPRIYSRSFLGNGGERIWANYLNETTVCGKDKTISG